MTRQEYELIAKVVAGLDETKNSKHEVAFAFIKALQQEYGRFKVEKFWHQCLGVKMPTDDKESLDRQDVQAEWTGKELGI